MDKLEFLEKVEITEDYFEEIMKEVCFACNAVLDCRISDMPWNCGLAKEKFLERKILDDNK